MDRQCRHHLHIWCLTFSLCIKDIDFQTDVIDLNECIFYVIEFSLYDESFFRKFIQFCFTTSIYNVCCTFCRGGEADLTYVSVVSKN
jgi:hypothetical protein